MKVIVYGATGMVGHGVLQECLKAADVDRVLAVGRTPVGIQHPKLQEVIRPDLSNYDNIGSVFDKSDACFFCLGKSSAGMQERDYERITYGLTLAAAEALIGRNPQMTFVYVSGAGADSSEKGRTMWARVRGKTENALLRMNFKAVYVFRPSIIPPVHGATSKTDSYRLLYALLKPLLPLMHNLFPNYVLTTEELGQAMLRLARHGKAKAVLESRDIRAVLNDPQLR